MTCDDFRKLLDAYIDGELDLVRSLEAEKHLEECPACARMHEGRRSLRLALAGAPLRFPPPAGLKERVLAKARSLDEGERQAASRRAARWDWRAWSFGAFSGAACSALLAVILRQAPAPAPAPWTQDVTAAHVRSMMTGHMTDVESSSHHVVKPWFNGRLDFSPPVVDFAERGYALAGGRVDYAAGRRVAALVYRHGLHPIDLFLWPGEGTADSGTSEETRQGYHLIRWTGGGMTHCLISDMNEKEMEELADLIRRNKG